MNITYIEFDDYMPAPHKQKGLRSSVNETSRSFTVVDYTIEDLGDKIRVAYRDRPHVVVVPWSKVRWVKLADAPERPAEATVVPQAQEEPQKAPAAPQKRRGRPRKQS